MTRYGCHWCNGPLPKRKPGTVGRPAYYCSDTCFHKAAWARRTERALLAEQTIDGVVRAEPERTVRPLTWWVAQAEAIAETCAKCDGPVRGQYIPPTQSTMNECAVVAHCQLCGSERVLIAGHGGTPYAPAPVLTDEERAAAERRSALGRHAVGYRVYRPPRVAGGQGKTRDNLQRWKERDAQR